MTLTLHRVDLEAERRRSQPCLVRVRDRVRGRLRLRVRVRLGLGLRHRVRGRRHAALQSRPVSSMLFPMIIQKAPVPSRGICSDCANCGHGSVSLKPYAKSSRSRTRAATLRRCTWGQG